MAGGDGRQNAGSQSLCPSSCLDVGPLSLDPKGTHDFPSVEKEEESLKGEAVCPLGMGSWDWDWGRVLFLYMEH